jgi:hypothetical protein
MGTAAGHHRLVADPAIGNAARAAVLVSHEPARPRARHQRELGVPHRSTAARVGHAAGDSRHQRTAARVPQCAAAIRPGSHACRGDELAIALRCGGLRHGRVHAGDAAVDATAFRRYPGRVGRTRARSASAHDTSRSRGLSRETHVVLYDRSMEPRDTHAADCADDDAGGHRCAERRAAARRTLRRGVAGTRQPAREARRSPERRSAGHRCHHPGVNRLGAQCASCVESRSGAS